MPRSLLSQHCIAPVVWLDMLRLAGNLSGRGFAALSSVSGVRTAGSASPHAGECQPLGGPNIRAAIVDGNTGETPSCGAGSLVLR